MKDDNYSRRHDTGPVKQRETVESEWNERVPPVTAIAEAIATAMNCDPLRMRPLHDYVDTDALAALVTSGASHSSELIRVGFRYESYTVLVESDGNIEVSHTDNAVRNQSKF